MYAGMVAEYHTHLMQIGKTFFALYLKVNAAFAGNTSFLNYRRPKYGPNALILCVLLRCPLAQKDRIIRSSFSGRTVMIAGFQDKVLKASLPI